MYCSKIWGLFETIISVICSINSVWNTFIHYLDLYKTWTSAGNNSSLVIFLILFECTLMNVTESSGSFKKKEATTTTVQPSAFGRREAPTTTVQPSVSTNEGNPREPPPPYRGDLVTRDQYEDLRPRD
ncbi:unnamed protein product [Schistosoma turkestanicum]|nr:unnamed protein product [Schistosoma turkestanicum]